MPRAPDAVAAGRAVRGLTATELMGVSTVLLFVLVLATTALVGAIVVLVREQRQGRRDQTVARMLALFGPAIPEAREHPRRLVAWAEVARGARARFPDAFDELDAATGTTFPFSDALIEGAHSRWTAEWLAWERQHDLEYKRQTREVESELDRLAGAGVPPEATAALRTRLDAIEQEKLQTYQARYEDYVRLGKAMADLQEPSPSARTTQASNRG